MARSQSSGTVADNLSIRGVATENRTSFRLNGGLPVNNLIEMPLENKERVEVLKGSSALYYGFTSPAGVVNLVTKRARPEPITSFTLSGNEFGQYIGHVDVGRQFSAGGDNKVGVRVNVAGGEVRYAIDDYEGARQLFAAAVDVRASDKLTFKFDVEDIRRTAVEQGAVGLNAAVNGRDHAAQRSRSHEAHLRHVGADQRRHRELPGPRRLHHQRRLVAAGGGRACRDQPPAPGLLAVPQLQRRDRRGDAARVTDARPGLREREPAHRGRTGASPPGAWSTS